MESEESDIRSAVFLWLKEKSIINNGIFDRSDLAEGINYKGRRITLIGAKGIWFPKGFSTPISITTTTNGPYPDGLNEDGLLEYSYRGNDPQLSDNLGLKKAFIRRTPLIYFISIKPGKYLAIWPLFLIKNDPENLKVTAAIDPAYNSMGKKLLTESDIHLGNNESAIGIRRYVTAEIKQRLHQSKFRVTVLEAYSCKCAVCRLQHVELLDAAHIIPDNEPDGDPVVQNGLSLCKIHHAAFDQRIIGITPDYIIKVRKDILDETDGPMLRYGLQSMQDSKIILPHRHKDYPDRDRLDRKYKLFLAS